MTDNETLQGESSSLGVDNQKLGIWTLLGSEAVFFSVLITTYIIMHGRNLTGPYPHEVLNVTLTAINTMILICSSLTMVSALAAIQRGDQRKLRIWLIGTIVLGLFFLGGQVIEFSLLVRDGLSMRSNLFGSTFFTLTGFHGAHVAVGIIWLGFVLIRAISGELSKENHMSVELVGLYWHFVDLVWILILTIVYLI